MEGSDVAVAPDHLVEAATALANLMASSPSSSRPAPSNCPRSVVSDNDDDSTNRALKFSPSSDSAKREMFPHKLMAILNDPTLSEIVSWLPHGRSFVIIRPDVFTDRVLPQYLPPLDSRSSTKYPSFTRKLNRWGFRQATRGPDTGAFHHPLFRRDKPELADGMVCQRSRDRKPEAKCVTPAAAAKSRASAANKTPPTRQVDRAPPATPTADGLDGASPTSAALASCAASVTDDSRSEDSCLSDTPPHTSNCARIPRGITTDKAVVAMSLQKRDEMERLRVAKAMLYESFIQALGTTREQV